MTWPTMEEELEITTAIQGNNSIMGGFQLVSNCGMVDLKLMLVFAD